MREGLSSASATRTRVLRAALLALALAPAVAAQPEEPADDTLRIVGSWELMSVDTHWPDGRVTQRWGTQPLGRLTYDAEGWMVALLMHEGRNQANARAVAPEMLAECAGYFGTYRVDTQKRIVYHTVAASIRASESGTLERAYKLQTDRLSLTAKGTRDGLLVTHVYVWRRLSRPGARREVR